MGLGALAFRATIHSIGRPSPMFTRVRSCRTPLRQLGSHAITRLSLSLLSHSATLWARNCVRSLPLPEFARARGEASVPWTTSLFAWAGGRD